MAIPTSKQERKKILRKTAIKAGTIRIKSAVKRPFLSAEAAQIERDQSGQELANTIYSGLSQLRGTALKFAQLFSGETGLLSEEQAKVFEQSHYRVPPLNFPIVRKIFIEQFKVPPEYLFKSFEYQAFAAASLGQVHRAELKSGEQVAVKIQYPGIDETIKTDMELLKRALSIAPFAKALVKTLEEIESRLVQEVDYRIEADHLDEFASRKFKTSVLIPKPHRQTSGRTILTADFIEGLSIDAWVKSQPSAQERNRIGQGMFDFFTENVFDHKSFHADPNFGNFLIKGDGQLAVIDFGAVKKLPAEDIEFYRALWNHHRDPNEAFLLEEYEKRGAQLKPGGVASNQDFLKRFIRPYCEWIAEPLRQKNHQFGSVDFMKRGHQIFTREILNPAVKDFSPQLTLLHRTLYGVFVILTRLQAQVDMASF